MTDPEVRESLVRLSGNLRTYSVELYAETEQPTLNRPEIMGKLDDIAGLCREMHKEVRLMEESK